MLPVFQNTGGGGDGMLTVMSSCHSGRSVKIREVKKIFSKRHVNSYRRGGGGRGGGDGTESRTLFLSRLTTRTAFQPGLPGSTLGGGKTGYRK